MSRPQRATTARIQPEHGEPYIVSIDRDLIRINRRSMTGNLHTITMSEPSALAVADALVDAVESRRSACNVPV